MLIFVLRMSKQMTIQPLSDGCSRFDTANVANCCISANYLQPTDNKMIKSA